MPYATNTIPCQVAIAAFEDVRAKGFPGKFLPPPPKVGQKRGSDVPTEELADSESRRASTRHATVVSSETSRGKQTQKSRETELSSLLPDQAPKSDMPPMIQSASYAANMLSHSATASHTINLVIIDQKAWIWWCDRQGAIQSTGVDFTADLPRFLVLLLAFQRFKLSDWGFISQFNPAAHAVHAGSAVQPASHLDYPSISVAIKHHIPALHHRYTLRGRGTYVADVDVLDVRNPQRIPPPIPGTEPRQHEYVIKLSWVDEKRAKEFDLVERLREDPRLRQHLPWIVDAKEEGFSTTRIRQALGVNPRTRVVTVPGGGEVEQPIESGRSLCSVVSEKLQPVEKLSSEDFLKVFLDVVWCHYVSWTERGVYHRDPSVHNVMYREGEKGEKLGVLNDWDLATDIESMHDGLERTGTVPFMALELLDDSSGQIKHQYRHDLEAFYWVLVWLCYPEHTFMKWETGSYAECHKEKTAFLHKGGTPGIKSGWEGAGMVMLRLGKWLRDMSAARATLAAQALENSIFGDPPLETTEPAPGHVWGLFCLQIEACKATAQQRGLAGIEGVLDRFLKRA
ncbi:hypothetical protein PENSPDRAFT_171019 [Peniophora sp. CONT]|nr:hypothetical protein PENSPDRAFT_171019 [Peniophora sp. CONT]